MNKIVENDKKIIELGKILKNKRTSKKLSLRNVQDILEKKGIALSYSGIKKIEEGKIKNLDIRFLKVFVEIYNLDFNNIFYLAGINLQELSKIMKLKEEESLKKVLLYGQASAGNGYINLELEIGDYKIPKGDYKENYFAIKVAGDSMTGEDGIIPDGSIALIDPNINTSEITKNKVYVLTYKGETYIKQYKIDSQGLIRLHSFNKDYEDIIVLDINELVCNGRVVKIYFEKNW